jgi:hypothetical protein
VRQASWLGLRHSGFTASRTRRVSSDCLHNGPPVLWHPNGRSHHLRPGQSRAHERGHRGLGGPVCFACTLFLGRKSSRKSAVRSLSWAGKYAFRAAGEVRNNGLAGGSSPSSPTTHSFERRDFPATSKRPAIGGLRRRRFGLRGDFSGREAFLGELSLALGIPFPGNGDRRQQRRGSNVSTAQSNPASDADATIRRGGRKVGPRPFRGGAAHRWPP